MPGEESRKPFSFNRRGGCGALIEKPQNEKRGESEGGGGEREERGEREGAR